MSLALGVITRLLGHGRIPQAFLCCGHGRWRSCQVSQRPEAVTPRRLSVPTSERKICVHRWLRVNHIESLSAQSLAPLLPSCVFGSILATLPECSPRRGHESWPCLTPRPSAALSPRQHRVGLDSVASKLRKSSGSVKARRSWSEDI